MSLSVILLASMQAADAPPPPVELQPAPAPLPPPKSAAPERPPEPNLDPVPRYPRDNWVRSYDYPTKAVDEKREGSTRVRLQISKWGRVASCTVITSSGHSDLDEAACNSIGRRMSFDPATDANAKPIAGTIEHTVNWRLNEVGEESPPLAVAPPAPYAPGEGSLPRAPRAIGGYAWPTQRDAQQLGLEPGTRYRVAIAMMVSPEGKITECMVTDPSESDAANDASCGFVDRVTTVRPALDINGNPTVGKVSRTIYWRAPRLESDVSPTPPIAPRPPIGRRPVSMPDFGTGTTGFALEHDAEGKVISCKTIKEGNLPVGIDFASTMCDRAKERGVETVTNENGEKVGRKVRIEMRFTTEKAGSTEADK